MKVKKLAGILAIVVLMTSVLCFSASADMVQPTATYAELTDYWSDYLNPLTNSSGKGGNVYVTYSPGEVKSHFIFWEKIYPASASIEYQNTNGPTPNDVSLSMTIRNSNVNVSQSDSSSEGNSLGWKSLSFGIGSEILYATSVFYYASGYGTSVSYTYN